MQKLIESIFNIKLGQIQKLETVGDGDCLISYIRLKRSDDMYCPICNIRLIGNGIKQKQINHKVLTDRNMKLIYEANRYRCKRCGYSTFERTPSRLRGSITRF